MQTRMTGQRCSRCCSCWSKKSCRLARASSTSPIPTIVDLGLVWFFGGFLSPFSLGACKLLVFSCEIYDVHVALHFLSFFRGLAWRNEESICLPSVGSVGMQKWNIDCLPTEIKMLSLLLFMLMLLSMGNSIIFLYFLPHHSLCSLVNPKFPCILFLLLLRYCHKLCKLITQN